MTPRLIMKLMVISIIQDTPTVKVLTLKHPSRNFLPTPSAGAHVDIHLPDGKVRQYSLCGDPNDKSIYKIAVRRENNGRGGSKWLHENVNLGSILHVSAPRNNFSLVPHAKKYVFIASGIGITPFVGMAKLLADSSQSYLIQYCVQSEKEAPLLRELQTICNRDQLRIWTSEKGDLYRFKAESIGQHDVDTHIYCCGSSQLIDSVRAATKNWPESQVHFEVFSADVDSNYLPESFNITIASTGEVIHVDANQSALEALNRRGWNIASSCGLGICGSCKCEYSDGTVIHRDTVLSHDQRRDKMMLCVSRARGGVTLNL